MTAIRDIAGARYRVERGADGFHQIPLRGGKGHVYAHGRGTLGADIESTRPHATFNAIKRKCPAASIHVEGNFKIIVLHPVEGCAEFLRACRAKTRRSLSEEHKQILAASISPR